MQVLSGLTSYGCRRLIVIINYNHLYPGLLPRKHHFGPASCFSVRLICFCYISIRSPNCHSDTASSDSRASGGAVMTQS